MIFKNSSQNILRTEFENSILHGLSCEWEAALWVLEPPLSKKMEQPFFSLKTMKQKLAYWDAKRCEICFSTDFVLNYPWDSVKEVLLHEMAHQFTSEVFTIRSEPPHGKSFQQACILLRANPKASGSYAPLSERIKNPEIEENDKIMFKVQKLLALAESNHIHEAEAAVAKAHKLIKKYNIDMLQKNTKRDFVSICVGKPALRHFRDEYALANLLTKHYFVYGIWISAYVIEKGKMGRVLEISGTLQNIKIASYVYDFVHNYINSSWALYNKNKKHTRYRKTDFATGIIDGFTAKLNQQKAPNNETSNYRNNKNLPSKIEDKKLTEYTSFKYPNTKSFRRSASQIDDKINSDGKKIGNKLIISKGIEKKSKGNIKYLPNR